MKKYGKLMLSAYLMKKIKSKGSQKSKISVNKLGELILGAYILNKLKSEKSQKEIEETEEIESKGASTTKVGKILKGALVGAAVLGVLAWSYGFISYKKQNAQKHTHKIQPE